MSVLAHFFESYGFSTVLVGFVKEHIEAIQPPRALWLDFPMGRPLGKPNDPEYQKKIIRSAFDLFNERSGPVLKDFPDIIPCLLYTSPSPRDYAASRMPSSA